VLGPTVLYCHFVACSVVQQPASNKVLAANMSAMCFFMVFFVVCDFGLTLLLGQRACTTLCTDDFSICGLYHEFMKAGLRISIKDFHRPLAQRRHPEKRLKRFNARTGGCGELRSRLRGSLGRQRRFSRPVQAWQHEDLNP
jgi:hypothetical protein